jgi:hypothetical protein
MRLFILPIAILASLCHGGVPKLMVWKKVEFDSSGTTLWTDSLCYDKHGKLLAEYRKDAEAQLLHSIRFHYDDSGRSHKAVKFSPDDRILEEARCDFAGRKLTSWTRVADNITMDGISFYNDSAGSRIAYIQVATIAYRFTLDKHGNALKVSLLGGMGGSVQAYADFGYDSRRRHTSTRFFGADGTPIGMDTILRGKSGAMRELHRFDAAGLQVATVVHDYGSRGELKQKSFRESGRKVMMKRDQTFLDVDSLGRLNALVSEWKGPAVTGPCNLSWYWNVDLGIEPATLHGMSLPQAKDKAGDQRPVNPYAIRDSLDRTRDLEAEWLKVNQSEWGACRVKPNPGCIKQAYADLSKLVKDESARWYLSEAIDSCAGLVLELDGDRAYSKLLVSAKVEDPSHLGESVVIRKLLKYRLDKAYSRFCRTPEAGLGLGYKNEERAGFKLPEAPGDLPGAFREAWLYRWKILHGGKEPPEPDTARADKWTQSGLYRHILAFLRKDKPEILDSIRPYAWGGWCGTGSESLYGPKGDALLIVDLERGDLHASMSRTSDPERIRQMLICREMDWESFFLGGIFHNDYESGNQAMGIIARYGSLDAFRRLMVLRPGNERSYPRGYVEALGTFLVGPGKHVPAGESRWGAIRLYRDARAPALPMDLRKQALDRLTEMVDGNPYKLDALVFSRIFASLDFPNRDHILKRLAAVPFPDSRKVALDALEKMGAKPGPLPPFEPVKLVLTTHGKHFPSSSISVGFPCPEKDASCDGKLESSTNSEDGFSLSRATYLHAWYEAKALRLYNYYSGSENPLDYPIFNATIPLAEAPAGPIPVEIPLRTIELKLDFPGGFQMKQEKQIRVRLHRLDRDADSYYSSFEVGLRKQLIFSRLGDGFYEFGLDIPGLQTWRSGKIEVKGNAVHSIAMRKGSDVKYRIRSKLEGDSAFAVKVGLRHASLGLMKRSEFDTSASNLQSFSGQQDGFMGLPLGRYALELTSEVGPATPNSKTTNKVREFMISEDSPDRVDLGEIWINPPQP